jgi:DNA-binding winged helix-turn-helix (wHTH) protein
VHDIAYYHLGHDDRRPRKFKGFRHQWSAIVKVRFESFVLDAPARRLTRDGADLHLSPKAFDLLVLLIEQRPAVVDKAALRERLWPGVHVVDASLSNLVTEIRAAFGRGAAVPALLRTVHGVGYAFDGVVDEVDRRSSVSPAAGSPHRIVWQDRPIALPAGEHVIGRDASCTVWIEADDVSRRHARIRVDGPSPGAEVTVEDLGSTNGTYLHGKRLSAVTRLADGDRLRIGSATLVFRAARSDDKPTRRVGRPGGRSAPID